jgi:hypothetical protein
MARGLMHKPATPPITPEPCLRGRAQGSERTAHLRTVDPKILDSAAATTKFARTSSSIALLELYSLIGLLFLPAKRSEWGTASALRRDCC